MSTFDKAATPGDYQSPPPVTFIAANGTLGKILVDKLPAGGGSQGMLANANLTGGGRVLDLTATSTDSSAKDVILYIATETTLGTAMGTIGGSTSTITRTAGSYVTDGWTVGDLGMIFGAVTTTQNNGLLWILTGLASGTLTVNGTPLTTPTNESTLRLFRVSPLARVTVAANAGVGATNTQNNSLIGSSVDASIDRTGIWLGANQALVGAPQAAVSALPAYISVLPRLARY